MSIEIVKKNKIIEKSILVRVCASGGVVISWFYNWCIAMTDLTGGKVRVPI